MKDYFSITFYIVTFIVRALWSLVICVVCLSGMGVASTTDIKHNQFEFCYFLIVFTTELGCATFYFILFIKQRNIEDLEQINKRDCIGSCILIFCRLGFHIALSMFIVVRITEENFIRKNFNWLYIRNLTYAIMALTSVHIIGYIVGLIY